MWADMEGLYRPAYRRRPRLLQSRPRTRSVQMRHRLLPRRYAHMAPQLCVQALIIDSSTEHTSLQLMHDLGTYAWTRT